MASFDFFDIAAFEGCERSIIARWRVRFAGTAGAMALAGLLAPSAAMAVDCQFAPRTAFDDAVGVMPQLLIDETCTDPAYNESTFVITNTENLTFQVPGGALIPYTQITGNFPPTNTVATLPPGVTQDPTTMQQNYVLRFPAAEFWQNRSFEVQHPTGGGIVDNRLAFTNGAFSVNWLSASIPNAVASHRHQAGATKVAKAMANTLYGNTAKIYSYIWGCSGGGTVAMAHAENTIGVWDGVQPHCIGTNGDAQYHSFHWQAHYTFAIPAAKRAAIAAAAVVGGTGDIYAGLNAEEKSVLDEFISAGYPLAIIGNHFTQLTPLVDPIDIRLEDPTYEDDFWSLPGYAGSNPPNYLTAAKVDGMATITGITRNASNVPTAVQFDPSTIPAFGTTGANYMEYFVFDANGNRVIDPVRTTGAQTNNKRRFSLQGTLNTSTGLLTLSSTQNSSVLLEQLEVGRQIRINNRFILAIYFYPRHSILPKRSYDQYRNANGTPKYPQRADISVLSHSNYRTMGGRVETGDLKAKVMIMEGLGDNLSWPIFNASYAQQIQQTMGAGADDMMRFYLHDNGSHAVGGGQATIFNQALIDMIAWVEDDIAPKPSSVYSIDRGQVKLAPQAEDRDGLQPVIESFTANGTSRAVVAVDQPVNLVGHIETPPDTGEITQYHWTVAGVNDPPTILAVPSTAVDVSRTLSFATPGTRVVRLNTNAQRDGIVAPTNLTLLPNFRDVRVVVLSGALVQGDLNEDSLLNDGDYQLIRRSLGKCSGQPGFVPSTDLNGNGCVDYSDYQSWYAIYRSH